MILYTSGSTGRLKGVQLSHDGQLWTIRSRFLNRKDFDDERFIVAAPMFHMNALANCKFALAAHASIVLLPQFDTHRFIEALGRHEVTWITSVPTMMALVVKEKQALAQIDTARVRYIRMGSAPATDQLYEAVRRAFPMPRSPAATARPRPAPSSSAPPRAARCRAAAGWAGCCPTWKCAWWTRKAATPTKASCGCARPPTCWAT